MDPPASDRRAPRQRTKGPSDDATRGGQGAAASALARGEAPARARSRARRGARHPAVRARSEVSECVNGLGLAVCVSRLTDVSRSAVGSAVGITCTRRLSRKRWPMRCGKLVWRSGRAHTRFVIHSRRICSRTATTFAPCRSCSGIGTCEHDDDVFARPQSRSAGCPQPGRSAVRDVGVVVTREARA